MKKALLVLTRCPYPINGGRETILAQTIDFLNSKYDLTIVYLKRNHSDQSKFDERKLKNYPLKFPSIIELIYNILFRRNFSLQENLFFSRSNLELVDQTIKSVKPDLIYVDMIRMSQYIENYNIYKIIDIDDLLSIRYKRFMNQKESSIFGTFSTVVPSFLKELVEKILKNTILEYESKKLAKREIEVVAKYNRCFLVSEKEKKYLIDKTSFQNIYTNTQAIRSRTNIYRKDVKCNNLLFIGNMNTAQNKASLKMIADEILPRFTFDYTFFIIGEYDNSVEALISENSNIKLLGFVPDLLISLEDIKLALMPIAFGTGIKTKILDCMSYGIPVVTNLVGSEGLGVIDSKQIFIFENNEITNSSILSILKNDELLESISSNGYKYIKERHNFDTLRDCFLNLLDQ